MKEEILVGLIIGLSLIILGLLVYRLKLDWVISGYNTLPKDKKINVQIDKIRLLFRNFFMTAGFLLCVNAMISHFSRIKFIHPTVIVLLIILFLFSNYQIGKYDNNTKGGMVTIYRIFHR